MLNLKNDRLSASAPRGGLASCLVRAIWTALLDGGALVAKGVHWCLDIDSPRHDIDSSPEQRMSKSLPRD